LRGPKESRDFQGGVHLGFYRKEKVNLDRNKRKLTMIYGTRRSGRIVVSV